MSEVDFISVGLELPLGGMGEAFLDQCEYALYEEEPTLSEMILDSVAEATSELAIFADCCTHDNLRVTLELRTRDPAKAPEEIEKLVAAVDKACSWFREHPGITKLRELYRLEQAHGNRAADGNQESVRLMEVYGYLLKRAMRVTRKQHATEAE